MADTEILEGQIQALESAVLATDKRVDELRVDGLEGNYGDAQDDTIPSGSSTPVEPVIDLAQTVGRLEAELEACKSQIQAQQLEMEGLKFSLSAITAIAASEQEPEPEPELTVTEIEAPEEPESQSGDEGEVPARNPNWLERLLLVQ